MKKMMIIGLIATLMVAMVVARVAPRGGDTLTPDQEKLWGTIIGVDDSDGDGLFDSDEVSLGCDPTNPDTDGDGVPDGGDANPKNSDADNDGSVGQGDSGESAEIACSDGHDNDGDDLVDCNDGDCAGDAACMEPA